MTRHTSHGRHRTTRSTARHPHAFSSAATSLLWSLPVGSSRKRRIPPSFLFHPCNCSGLRPVSSLLLTRAETNPVVVSPAREETAELVKPEKTWQWRARARARTNARTHARTHAGARRGGKLAPGLAPRRARGSRTQQVGLRRRRQLWELRHCVAEVPDVCGSGSATLRLSPGF